MIRRISIAGLSLGLLFAMGGFASFEAQEPKAAPKKAAKAAKAPPQKKPATGPEFLEASPGFKIELLHTADPVEEGSFINLGKDNKGRLIVSGQANQPLSRFTIADGKVAKIEKLDIPLHEAMGILWAADSLYLNASGPEGYGLYRCKEVGDTGKFKVEFLKHFAGSGEHGPHALNMGPDGKIYVICGNHTKLPEGIAATSPHRNYQEDHLLPRQWDGNGHAAGILAPGGYIVRSALDDCKNWELVLAGFRNAYDFTFNGDGEIFSFDSDMEWDWGMPWYRPIRINHGTSAADFGWRSGTGKWPAYYPDSLPGIIDIGIGSPTGVTTGAGAKFPAKYQKAVYALDWTYGRLLAIHLTPSGSSYTATAENFVATKSVGFEDAHTKKALPLTDAVIGDDGAMYFTIGGRNNQAALYRVSYIGSESTAPANLKNEAGAADRQLRHELEAFHGHVNPKAVATAWPLLASPDRYMRYAARIAIEMQPVAEWKDRALAENNPTSALTALLALARVGEPKTQAELLKAMEKFSLPGLSPALQLDKLRTLGVSFVRQGRPGIGQARQIIAELDPLFPSASKELNYELAQVLIYLQAPGIAEKTLKQMATATTQQDLVHYLFHLRSLPVGNWTMAQRKEYLSYWSKDFKGMKMPADFEKFFTDAGQVARNGNSYANFMKNFLREAVMNLSDAERKELEPILVKINAQAVPSYDVKARTKVVKAWTMADIQPKLDKVEKGRNYEKGREAYLVGQCIRCHRCGEDGGAVGPDLTAVVTRFDRRTILESIIEPSKVLSDQYQNEKVQTSDGRTVVGRIVDDNAKILVIQPDPLMPERIEVLKSNIESRAPSKVSPMPEHLVDTLTEEEILDLIAYLESAGLKKGRNFSR